MRRRWIDRALMVVAALCALCALGFIGFVVLAIAVRGASSLSWGFLTEQIRLVGAAGGIFHNLVGTGILLVTATVVCVPLATAVALVHSVYLRGHCARRWLWRTLCVLNGVPSILFGIVGFIVLVKLLGLGKSWLNGGVLLGAMMLP
jgi:phosphate transport system permease protein